MTTTGTTQKHSHTLSALDAEAARAKAVEAALDARITALDARVDALEASAPPVPPDAGTGPGPAPSPVTLFDDFSGVSGKWAKNYRASGLPAAQTDPKLAAVSGGLLHLKAEKRPDGLWYSAAQDTKLTFKQKYGLFEARIKVPEGKGLWPAGPWGYDDATGQEIDGMEILANPVGTADATHDVRCLHCTLHRSGASGDQDGSAIQTGINLSADFHVYAFEWRATFIAWFLDGKEVKRYTGAGIPSVALPVILDLGVGGWAGPTDATTPNPSEMLVDWVRVCQ